MQGFYYVYRGPKTSLFARYGTALFVTDEINETKYESQIPGLGHLFDRGLNVVIHTKPESVMFTREIDFNDLNNTGELAVKRNEKWLYSYAQAHAISHGKNLHIKQVSNPGPWYERLAVYAAIKTRRCKIESLSNQWGINLCELERDINRQIQYLSCLKLLPPEVDWMKTMKAFKSVYPKPAWWYQEIHYFKLQSEGKLWK